MVDMTDESFSASLENTELLLTGCHELTAGVDLDYLFFIANRVEVL